MKSRILKFLYFWAPAVLWALMIFHFSSGTVPLASQVYWQDFTVKKIGHMLLYGTLSVLTYRALRGYNVPRKKALIWSIVVATFYGVTDEYHQTFTQGREGTPRDLIFDFSGALIASTIVYQFLPKIPKRYLKYFEELNLI